MNKKNNKNYLRFPSESLKKWGRFLSIFFRDSNIYIYFFLRNLQPFPVSAQSVRDHISRYELLRGSESASSEFRESNFESVRAIEAKKFERGLENGKNVLVL